MSKFQKFFAGGALVLSIAALGLGPVRADKPKPAPATQAAKACKWKTLSFTPSVPMSDQGNAGSDRVSFFNPVEVKPDEPRIRVFLAEVDQETFKALDARGTLLKAQVSTLMGLGKDSDGPKTRAFFGKDIAGGIWTADYPPRTIEAYIVPLPSGAHAFVALERTNVIDSAKAEAVFAAVTKSLAEGK